MTPEAQRIEIEKPMLFSGPMVRAILNGRKTQTRRVMKPQPPNGCYYAINGAGDHALCFADIAFGIVQGDKVCIPPTPKSRDHRLPCPHPMGSVIWVKETHYYDRFNRVPKSKPDDLPMDFYYRADGECCQQIQECQCGSEGKPKWRPSIFMPRWASRITLEVTAVRVERLQDIPMKDAIAEGVEFRVNALGTRQWRDYSGHMESFGRTATESYKTLWDSINAKKHPWGSNPWVWVYSFRRIKP